MPECVSCAYYDAVTLRCTAPAMLQDGRQFIPPVPETFASPYYLSREVALRDRLINALGVVIETKPGPVPGGPSIETYVLPDGSEWPAQDFRPWANVSQVAHMVHLARTRGVFINYGPVEDATSDKWIVKEAAGIEREATAYTAPQVIVETIVSRLEQLPPPPPPAVLPTINSFTATPDATDGTVDVILEWSVLDADMLTIDNGIGDVTGAAAWLVFPTATTTYTLIARSSAGFVTASVTVTVTPPPVA